jgi:hypothetical protein
MHFLQREVEVGLSRRTPVSPPSSNLDLVVLEG